jgi:hypothetical protein
MKALALNKDGSLKLLEADVCKQIVDYLGTVGFQCIRTPTTRIKYPSGKWGMVFEEGFADYICVRPREMGQADFFYAELKRPKASTEKEHRTRQAEWERVKSIQGFLVYRAKDSEPDQLEAFKAWFGRHY